MRDLVNKKSFLVRKKLDNLLHWLAPDWWVPLYTSVTFSRMRYHQCIKNRYTLRRRGKGNFRKEILVNKKMQKQIILSLKSPALFTNLRHIE